MFTKSIKYVFLAGASIAVFASVQAVAAQDDGAEKGDGEELEVLEEIIVSGVRGSIINALSQKRDSTGFVDAIAADDLGKFPDLNISESLQRIPGVTLFRNNTGDGQSITLRGLGPEFTRVEINGVTGTNNGTSGRFGGDSSSVGGGFNFEILASELFDNVQVSKTGSAQQVEGGLAGVVKLSTPHGFDRKGLNLSVSGQAQISEAASDVDPRGAIVVSNNWNDKFAISASLAYSKASFQSNSNGGISSRPLNAPATDALRASATPEQLAGIIPSTVNFQVDVEDRETIGLTGGLQWRPTEDLEITIDGIYAEIDSDRFFTRADAPPESSLKAISNDTLVDGVFQEITITDVQNRIAANNLSGNEDFTQVSATVAWQPNDSWKITPFIGYSERNIERKGQLLSFARGDLDTGNLIRTDVTIKLNRPFIEFSVPGTDFSANSDPSEFMLNVFLLRPTKDQDKEISGKLDFTRSFDDSPLVKIDFGGRFSNRKTSRSSVEVRIDDIPGTDLRTVPTLADALVVNDFDISGAPSSFPDTIITADPRAVLDLFGFDDSNLLERFGAKTGPVSNVDIIGETVAGTRIRDLQPRAANRTFDGEEETIALYAEATIEIDDIVINAGVRYIETDQTSNGHSVNADLGLSSLVSVVNSYSEFLPSMTVRYDYSDDMVIRAAYSRTLTRPTLFDLRVAESFGGIDESGGTGSRGNPNLDPFTSDNIDFGVEWYFAKEGLLAVTLFHKSIDGLVQGGTIVEDRTFLSQITSTEVTAPITFNIPINGDQTSINGVEFLAQSRFDFLPGILSNMGGIFNYTYMDSNAGFEETDSELAGVGITGLSSNSLNAILYYDDGTFDTRLSYAWRDRFLENNSASFGVPQFQSSFGQLDLSANYEVLPGMTLQFQVLNLTNQRLENTSIRNIPHTTTQLDRRWFIGARYKF
ncbi:MAG: hypothetical protein COB49_03075 [Alphaproteobacteria bacterium]|nr:MAG: hypothetical protein COB49_03075 [Alphaproteobacteria bacterium]